MGLGVFEVIFILIFFGAIAVIFGAFYFIAKYLTAVGGKTCPHCAEKIKVAAKVCRHCRLDVTGV